MQKTVGSIKKKKGIFINQRQTIQRYPRCYTTLSQAFHKFLGGSSVWNSSRAIFISCSLLDTPSHLDELSIDTFTISSLRSPKIERTMFPNERLPVERINLKSCCDNRAFVIPLTWSQWDSIKRKLIPVAPPLGKKIPAYRPLRRPSFCRPESKTATW